MAKILKKKKNQKKKKVIIFLSLLLIIFLITLSLTFWKIYKGVKTICIKAKEEYHYNCTNSLISLIQSEDKSFKEKNSAIWALGQIADSKTLPFLYRLREELPNQDKCNHNNFLCKYEIQKAIKWCEKGNLTHWMYQGRDEWK